MTQLSFSTGTLMLKRLDLPNQPIALLGILTDVILTFQREIHTTRGGEREVAIAAASGEVKVIGNAKDARLQATAIGDVFFGPSVVDQPGSLELAAGEDTVVPSGGMLTVVNAAKFDEDFGVFYQNGVQLMPTTSEPNQGQYQLAGPGTYMFNDHDVGQAITVYYSYTTIAGHTIVITNSIYGGMPFFEMILKQVYREAGTNKDLIVKLNNCFSSKLALPFTNQRYTVTDFDFQAIGDLQDLIGSMSLAE
jgi:hypothetical protein